MEHRTNDKGFFNCPICGQSPYVTIYPPAGLAKCNGSFLRRHKLISVAVGCEPPPHLYRELARKWNKMAELWNRRECDQKVTEKNRVNG